MKRHPLFGNLVFVIPHAILLCWIIVLYATLASEREIGDQLRASLSIAQVTAVQPAPCVVKADLAEIQDHVQSLSDAFELFLAQQRSTK